MQVKINDKGQYTLEAETERDNTLLFSIVNGVNVQGVRFEFPQVTKGKTFSIREMFSGKKQEKVIEAVANHVEEIVDKPTITDGGVKHERKRAYTKTCPVEGCNHKTKGLSIHMRMSHGILPDGSVSDTFLFNGGGRGKNQTKGIRPVKSPVVKLPNGTYKVRPVKGLLD